MGLRAWLWFRGARLAVALALGQAAILTLVGLAAPLVGQREPFKGDWDELVRTGSGLVDLVEANWQRWDALWYQHIATVGYGANDGSAAFYPLYPILARAVSIPSGDLVRAELFVSVVAAMTAFWLLWHLSRLEILRLLRARADQWTRQRWLLAPALVVLLTSFFPAGFFLLAPYTEGLFLALTLLSFWLMRTGRVWTAGVAGLFASLARTQGVLLVLPLAVEALRARGTFDWVRNRSTGQPPDHRLLAAFLPVAGTAAFAAYQAIVVRGQTGLGAQSPWGVTFVLPWDAVGASIDYVGKHLGQPAGSIEALNLASLFVALAVAVPGIRRLPVAYSLYALSTLGLYFVRTAGFSPLMSVSRYVLVVFPCFLFAGMWLSSRPRLATAWLVLSLVMQLVLFQYWVRWGFVA